MQLAFVRQCRIRVNVPSKDHPLGAFHFTINKPEVQFEMQNGEAGWVRAPGIETYRRRHNPTGGCLLDRVLSTERGIRVFGWHDQTPQEIAAGRLGATLANFVTGSGFTTSDTLI